jgi:hypothetical protein
MTILLQFGMNMDVLNPTPFLTLHRVADVKDIMNKTVEDGHNLALPAVETVHCKTPSAARHSCFCIFRPLRSLEGGGNWALPAVETGLCATPKQPVAGFQIQIY